MVLLNQETMINKSNKNNFIFQAKSQVTPVFSLVAWSGGFEEASHLFEYFFYCDWFFQLKSKFASYNVVVLQFILGK